MNKKRKYKDDYVAFGFTKFSEEDGTEKPQCFICGKVLANCSLKPSKLKKHFSVFHQQQSSSTKETLLAMKECFQRGQTAQCSSSTEKLLLEASFKISYRIAKEKKPHIIGETLIKPCLLETVELFSGDMEKEKYKKIPLSNNIVQSRIVDISNDIRNRVMQELKNSPFKFSLQLDETTDVSQCCQLLAFVRYVHNNSIKEEFLFCEKLTETSKGTDVLRIINDFFVQENFDWKAKLLSICTDGAPAMLGNTSGFTSLVKKEAPQISVHHCFLHKHALAAKTLPIYLSSILSTSVKVVNFIRARALNHRIFKSFCEAVGAEHQVLLYHTEVRWLSRGRILTRLFKLRTEVSIFLTEKKSDLSKEFDHVDFVHGLAYLADIFEEMNKVNLSIQGHDVYVIDAAESLAAWMNKLLLWSRRVVSGNYANFPLLDGEMQFEENDNEIKLSHRMKDEIVKHLETLNKSFNNYFSPENFKVDIWVRNPFICDENHFDISDVKCDEIIDLRARQLLKAEFHTKSLGDFWCSMTDKYPNLSNHAVHSLIPFATTYLCESGFSTLVAIKTARRNNLDVQHDMRIALSSTKPDFNEIIESKQQHPSH